MRTRHYLCLAGCLGLLLHGLPTLAQMRDAENAAPRARLAVLAGPAPCGELLHELTTTLPLQPAQVAALRQALAARFAVPRVAAAPAPELCGLLTETQLARLQQWEATQPDGQRIGLITSLR